MLKSIDLEYLQDLFIQANELFLKQEKELILSTVSERSWYTRFAIYLNKILEETNIKDYYIDTEYNRNNGKLKTIFDSNALEVISITCDIILHSRGKNPYLDNLICIEMKKSNRPMREKINDKKRLQLLTKKTYDNVWSFDGRALPEYVCGYQLGIYYEMNIKKQVVAIEYYQDGEIIGYDMFKF